MVVAYGSNSASTGVTNAHKGLLTADRQLSIIDRISGVTPASPQGRQTDDRKAPHREQSWWGVLLFRLSAGLLCLVGIVRGGLRPFFTCTVLRAGEAN